ncbi:MAG: YtxH domain-containing protein [Desulfobulbus sp.]
MEQYNQGQTLYPQSLSPLRPSGTLPGLDMRNTQFWKGVAIGAAVALLITNESVQKGVVKVLAKATTAAQCGIEEIKEKFEDAKAEAQAEAAMDETVAEPE